MLHAGSVPKVDLAMWDFRVFGEVENPIRLSWEELRRLPETEITTDIHCVTRWSRFDTSFRGVHWRDLAELIRPRPTAHFVVAHADEFTSNVPLEALEADDTLIAYEADGEPLTPDLAGRSAWSSRAGTSGRARSGFAASSCSITTSPASGSATATTTTPTSGRRSATVSRAGSRVEVGTSRPGSGSGGGRIEWHPEAGWDPPVTSFCVGSQGVTLVLDALDPEDDAVWELLDAAAPAAVVVVKPDHFRSAVAFAQRYGATLFSGGIRLGRQG